MKSSKSWPGSPFAGRELSSEFSSVSFGSSIALMPDPEASLDPGVDPGVTGIGSLRRGVALSRTGVPADVSAATVFVAVGDEFSLVSLLGGAVFLAVDALLRCLTIFIDERLTEVLLALKFDAKRAK